MHKKVISGVFTSEMLKELPDPLSLSAASINSFVHRGVKAVNIVRSYEICAGADQSELEFLWSSDNTGVVDGNPYDESRYVKTFRSHGCSLIVPVKHWTCCECKKLIRRLKQRHKNHVQDKLTIKGRNSYMNEEQLRLKLKEQRRELKKARSRIDYLEKRVELLLKVQGVTIDKDTGEALNDILRESKLTPIQQLFIQQQYKMSAVKGASGMRWHPTMIRFALLIKSTSTACYNVIESSEVIKLPSQRTLFDFEHAIPRSEGVFFDKLSKVGEKVKQYEAEYQHFHSLLMDEIHICHKLVYRKTDGSLVGYVKLSEVEQEMEKLTASINEGRMVNLKPAVATKVLAYMVKGCTSSIKEVIAAFPVASLSKEQLYDRTWKVIRACEEEGVKILAVICDGSSVNRAFFKMHTPATKCASNVVFDTVNLCALDRKLFFISDPPHLIKTIRNCFAKSGTHSKSTRLLHINGEFIQWQTIVRMFDEDKHKTWRKSCKLNAQNVHLNSYSCMKVSYAAQVLSKTVGLDLKTRNWPGTAATVDFILKVNDFFDNLNGAHSNQAHRTNNSRLRAYDYVNDKRFDELKQFEKYVLDWEEQVNNLTGFSDAQKAKMTLSDQTKEGIYITVNGFCGAVKYLLEIGAKFVMGRAFCQDPLEQYFGKQRASGGGRVNPTVSSLLNNDLKISIHRDLNVKRRSGNTEVFQTAMEVDNEPLPKRPRRRKSV